jgi:hypothetical protein
MSLTHQQFLCGFLLGVAVARADVVSYTAQASAIEPGNGQKVSFSLSLDVPRFDPGLGTLNSITFGLEVGGLLEFSIVSRNMSTFLPMLT